MSCCEVNGNIYNNMLYLCVDNHYNNQTSHDLNVTGENLHGQTCGYSHNIFHRSLE